MIHSFLEKSQNLAVEERRSQGEEYAELVIMINQLSAWEQLLSQHFGAAVKAAGKKPSADDLVITKAYGGIFREQTLFCRKEEENYWLAMLWPWQDKAHITLKLAKAKKE